MAQSQMSKTAQTWFQGKRIPLYIMVGGGLIGRQRVSKSEAVQRDRAVPVSIEQRCPDVCVVRYETRASATRLARTFAGAATYLSSRSSHPHIESSKAHRQDPLSEEREGMAAQGHAHKESAGRKATRCILVLTSGLFIGDGSSRTWPLHPERSLFLSTGLSQEHGPV